MRANAVSTPFHEGEIEIQSRAGERETAEQNGGMIAEVIPSGARPFLARQRMIVMAHETAGHVSASILFGRLGFASSSVDGSSVTLAHGLHDKSAVGLLAIDFATRRRLRVNGTVEGADRIRVREAYPNCPKYIRRRLLRDGEPIDRGGPEEGRVLDAPRLDTIHRADTLFVASRHPERGMDASHRGGNPGFVRIEDDTLVIPDYPGNGMFNSLGNFQVDPSAGICVLDFDRGRVLQLHGDAKTLFGKTDLETGGTDRRWTFRVRGWRETAAPETVRWETLDPSPFNP